MTPLNPGDVMLWALAALVVVVCLSGVYGVAVGLVRSERANRRARAWDDAAAELTRPTRAAGK
jgi:hypothetical protein